MNQQCQFSSCKLELQLPLLKFRPCCLKVLPCQVPKRDSHMGREGAGFRNRVNNPQGGFKASH